MRGVWRRFRYLPLREKEHEAGSEVIFSLNRDSERMLRSRVDGHGLCTP